jgi:hypothetical protein
MTKNTKNILMVGGLAVVGYLIYKQMSKPKNFANYVDDDFFNFGEANPPKTKESGIVQAGTRSAESIGATSCEVVSGAVAYAPMYLSNNRVVVRTGNGTSTICPRGQRYDLPR